MADDNEQFGIQKIYVKDISFEAPNSPEIFSEKWQPSFKLDLNTSTNSLDGDLYQVILNITLTVTIKDKTAYLIEVQQAGIFHIQGLSDSDMGGMLGSFCPNIIFPYARETISDVVTRAGFPQMALAPVNFDAIYAQHLQEQNKDKDKDKDK